MFFNRDLSWIGFNYRVLLEAKDSSVPLYERLKFLAIFSSNLDEFFRVRYPAIIAFSKLDKKTIRKESLMDEKEVYEKIHDRIDKSLDEFGDILINDLIPALKENKIFFYYDEPINERHFAEMKEIFLSRVLSFMQVIFVDTNTSSKFLPENNQIYLVVTLKHTEKRRVSHVILNIPSKKLKRFFVLEPDNDKQYIVYIDDIIRQNLDIIFPGQEIQSVYSIKFNRDAGLQLYDEYNVNLLDKLEKQLSKRETGNTSRFLYQKGMPSVLRLFLAELFGINLTDMFEGGPYHNLSDLFYFPSFNASLHYPKQAVIMYPRSGIGGDIFTSIIQNDVLLHLPYHSYSPVLSFFNQAAVDPSVTEIYITLYRVATESHIVNALISAAKNGKKVTAFIELKARFDEANNIKWSRIMKNAGVKIIYSDSRIKVHSKVALVKKKVKGVIVSYALFSTGNFNETTALFYTDHVLMTCHENRTKELQQLFEFLEKKKAIIDKAKIEFKELLVSRFNMMNEFERLVNIEIEKAKNGQGGLLRIKVNNLEEPLVIKLLYNAADAGVTIEIIARSICCLIPRANITVKRIVDRYLEHSRIFIFGNDHDAIVAMGSADLMTRNIQHRIEVCLFVHEEKSRRQLIDYFTLQWRDNVKADMLLADMNAVRIEQGATRYQAQVDIFNYLSK